MAILAVWSARSRSLAGLSVLPVSSIFPARGGMLAAMMIDDLPAKMLNTAAGDCVWLPYSGKVLVAMIQAARRQGWEYDVERHGLGVLLTCTHSPLGGQDDR